MAEPGRRPRTQGIAGTWQLGGRAQVGGFAPVGFDAWSSFVAKLKAWIGVEAGAGRLLPWVPVAFGAGIALYFTADREPVFWVTVVPAALLCGVCWPMRRHRLFAVAVLVAAVAAGFATATFRTARIAHTVLMRPLYSVALSVFVEARDIREKTDRFVLRATTMESPRGQLTLERVRLSVKKGTAPDVGSFVELKARLMPPLAPLRAGSYDFARDLYLRDAIDARILTRLDRDERAIATALLTGRRDAITEPVNDAMFISGLGHVLSISGYHMAVVAGVVFFVVRALLVLVPALTIGFPIKKWAAVAALGASAFYLLLSGAEVATQRSFYMTAVVLIAVIADRRAITFRTLALVAMIVLVIAPEALVHPSF